MSLKFHWFLPTNGGDGRQVVSGGHGVDAGAAGRPASVPYLGQVARSAEPLGFEAALTPTGAWCEDAWLSTAMLAPVTAALCGSKTRPNMVLRVSCALPVKARHSVKQAALSCVFIAITSTGLVRGHSCR